MYKGWYFSKHHLSRRGTTLGSIGNPNLLGALRVPDASIDPFHLTTANVLDARQHGADVLTYHEVVAILTSNGRVEGVRLRNNHTGEEIEKHAALVINAAGIWGHDIAKMADIKINMFPAKGTLLVFGHRVNKMVINRCRKPANADILVPDDAVCVIGTTSDRVPYDTVDNLKITSEEVDTLIREGEKLAPILQQHVSSVPMQVFVRSLQPIMTLQDAVSAVGLYA